MLIPPYFRKNNYGYDDGFTTIIFGCIGYFSILLSYFEFKFIKQNTTP